jgi:hypothetical protein
MIKNMSAMSATSTKIQKLDLHDLTAIIFCAGYESRFVQGNETLGSGEIDWSDQFWSESDDKTPLSAGGRLITPEEFDHKLAEHIPVVSDDTGTCADYMDSSPTFWMDRSTDLFTPTDPCSYKKLFTVYDPSKGDDPLHWRDQRLARRTRLYDAIQLLCKEAHVEWLFESGLCVCLKRCSNPFEIGQWIRDQFHCGCFSPNPISWTVIENDQHKLLVIECDGESG